MSLVQCRMFGSYFSRCSLDVRLVFVWIRVWYNVRCSVGTFLDVGVVHGWMLDSIPQPSQVTTAVPF